MNSRAAGFSRFTMTPLRLSAIPDDLKPLACGRARTHFERQHMACQPVPRVLIGMTLQKIRLPDSPYRSMGAHLHRCFAAPPSDWT